MGELFEQMKQVFLNLLNPTELMKVLEQPEIMMAAFIAVTMVIFTETGLLIGFFLPGDSLLVSVGIVAWNSDWPIVLLMGILSVAAIVGDSVGYWIGLKSGPRIFNREKSFFFRKDHLLMAQAFYEKHGGKTIILARFMPIIRTFAPVVAGVGKMDYRRFLMFNIVGGVAWIVSMLLLGYAITPMLDPPLKGLFGPEFQTAKHIEKVIILVVLISISPGIYAGLKGWMAKRKAAGAALATANAVTTPPL
ncbi:DedA family protein [Zavarzinella formosa]|uniref:DedA family protein n=1 Tax=Zavarzinella formosa TaxID=360055 RepID=UPI00036B1017|nr:VTT domain-containing protein [Zavarzinella formosa]